jgi:hypothetical protein
MHATYGLLASQLAAVETIGAEHAWSDADRRAYRAALRDRYAGAAPAGRAASMDVPAAATPLDFVVASLEALAEIAGSDPLLRAELEAAAAALPARQRAG